MRFLCDEMLTRLGRWLRAAGYDTLIQVNGGSDRVMLENAQRGGRLLITRDHKLMEFRNAMSHVILLRGNTLRDCVQDLSSRVDIDWLHRPFSRCLLCNSVLSDASPTAWRQVPSKSRTHVDKLLYCGTCAKVYWEGAHVRRMHIRLTHWQASI